MLQAGTHVHGSLLPFEMTEVDCKTLVAGEGNSQDVAPT
jgi:hypothetical protein